jgi:DNA-binding NtrC family response regulator
MGKRKGRILMVDDEQDLLDLSAILLRREGLEVSTCAGGEAALTLLNNEEFDLILLDLRMPGMDGLGFLELFKKQQRREEVVILTAYADVESAVKAVKLGAYGYLSKPFDTGEVMTHLDRILELQALRTENAALRQKQRGELGNLVGQSESMRQLYQLIRDVAPTPVTVLIRGESGTGKELVANAIHDTSDRAGKPFVRCNCAALSPGVMESELFGHVKGAFTGAVRDRAGRFAEADGGSLFLDEIGDLETNMQIRLLRVIQEGEFEPVGSTQTQKVDVRLITATHQDLEARIEEGTFREDLYYRINALTIEIPPLRERISDLPLLCAFFVSRYNGVLGKRIEGFTSEALQCLEEYNWPGNVRELRNVVERAVLLSEGTRLTERDFPMIRPRDGLPTGVTLPPAGTNLEAIERDLVVQALHRTGWNQTRAAALLGLNRDQIRYRIEKFALTK